MIFFLGIIHKARTQNLPKKQHFILPTAHTYVAYHGVRNVTFSEIFAYCLIDGPLFVLDYYGQM